MNCLACRFAEKKNNNTDWKLREKEVEDLLNRHRRKDGYWDVVVPCSGGKDSVYVAHILKEKYGMNPLTATWAPMLYTDVGWRNLHHMIDAKKSTITIDDNGTIMYSGCTLHQRTIYCPKHI